MGRIFTNATDPGGVVDTVDSGKDLTLPYLSTSGFSRPILIPEPDGLGLSAPDDDFILQDFICRPLRRGRSLLSV